MRVTSSVFVKMSFDIAIGKMIDGETGERSMFPDESYPWMPIPSESMTYGWGTISVSGVFGGRDRFSAVNR